MLGGKTNLIICVEASPLMLYARMYDMHRKHLQDKSDMVIVKKIMTRDNRFTGKLIKHKAMISLDLRHLKRFKNTRSA